MTIRVFIAHAWDYDHHYETLAGWIFGTPWHFTGTNRPILFENMSVPKHDPIHARGRPAIEEALAQRIHRSDIVVAPAGLYASHRDWIDFEVRTANYYGVPVLQVNPRGQQRLSMTIKQAADHEVNWNSQSVVNAILRNARTIG